MSKKTDEIKKSPFRLRAGDYIMFAVVIVIAVFFVVRTVSAERGEYVAVYSDGREIATYSLDKDGEYEIVSDDGYNIIRISDGKVSVAEADCNDGTCVLSGEIYRVGSQIVCMPHKLTVLIKGKSEVDAVS